MMFIIIILIAIILLAVVLSITGTVKRIKHPRKSAYINDHKPKGPYEKFIKRSLDCIIASGIIVVFSPLLLIITFLVRLKLGSPVLFVQERPGKNGQIFKLLKFRSMNDKKDENDKLLPDKIRLTPFGQKLRKYSIDELPELINIAEGDMAIVGPRPLLVKYLPLYNERQIRRHDVLPGLTGYAQAHGRNNASWEEKFDMDLKYIENITFANDVKIIWDTLISVLRHNDIESDATHQSNQNITMEEFTGSDT